MNVGEMLRLRLSGTPCKDIAEQAGCSVASVYGKTNQLFRRNEIIRRTEEAISTGGLACAPLEGVGLDQRAVTILRNEGVQTLGEAVAAFILISGERLPPGCGRKTLQEIGDKLVFHNLLRRYSGGLYRRDAAGDSFPVSISEASSRLKAVLTWAGYSDWLDVVRDIKKIERRQYQYGISQKALEELRHFASLKEFEHVVVVL